VRDAVLAAEEDRGEIDLLHPPPCLEAGVQDRGVVGRGDPRVVEEHVDAPEALAHLLVHRAHRRVVGDVGGQRQVARRAVAQVHARDARALAAEGLDRGGADPAHRARDDAHLALEPARHQASPVANEIVFTSV
jgi:hypothetical protein